MADISFDPALTMLGSHLSEKAASTITKVAMLCGASSLNFSSVAVLGATCYCIEQSLVSHPLASALVSDLLIDAHAALEELKDLGMVDPTKASGFQRKDHPLAS